jgi:hypothetical protein
MLRSDNKLWLSNAVIFVTVAPKASVLITVASHISDGILTEASVDASLAWILN